MLSSQYLTLRCPQRDAAAVSLNSQKEIVSSCRVAPCPSHIFVTGNVASRCASYANDVGARRGSKVVRLIVPFGLHDCRHPAPLERGREAKWADSLNSVARKRPPSREWADSIDDTIDNRFTLVLVAPVGVRVARLFERRTSLFAHWPIRGSRQRNRAIDSTVV